jgi:uncharacterized protein YeaO (DUF488 family)
MNFVGSGAGGGAMFKLKRIYEPPEQSDGCRVLVDRLWPRGVPKGKAQIDLWMKEIAPSDALRKWFGHDPERWQEFEKRYSDELRKNPSPVRQLRQLVKRRGTVTLIFSAHDVDHNQAVALRAFLEGKKAS